MRQSSCRSLVGVCRGAAQSLDLAPTGGDKSVVGKDEELSQEDPHYFQVAWTPATHERPLGQLAVGDEGDAHGVVGKLAG